MIDVEDQLRQALSAEADRAQPGMLRPLRPPRGSRLPGWLAFLAAAGRGRTGARAVLAPVAAAAAVVAVITGVFAVRQAPPGRPAGGGGAAAAVARAGVPRYYVALPGSVQGSGGPRAVVGATATGAVLGSVSAPKPYSVFTWAAASGNDRVFVLAAQRPMRRPGPSQYRFYRLVLSRSGRPGPLTPLPIPLQTGDINGFALSPDGTKLAMSFLPVPSTKQHSAIAMFTLANGNLYRWSWPGHARFGWIKPVARSLSWEADNRTLLFERNAASSRAGVFLLDTASGGRAPQRIPIPSQEPSATSEKGLQISGPMLITGDGTKIAAPTATLTSQGSGGMTLGQRGYLQLYRQCGASIDGFTKQNGQFTGVRYIGYRKTANCLRLIQQRDRYFRRNVAPRLEHYSPPTYGTTVTEFSVKTGKPVLVLDRQQLSGEGGPDVQWVNDTGTAMIVDVAGPKPVGPFYPSVIGIQDGSTFTPLPTAVQHAFGTGQLAW